MTLPDEAAYVAVAGELGMIDVLTLGERLGGRVNAVDGGIRAVLRSAPFVVCQIFTGFDSPVVPALRVTVKVTVSPTVGFIFEAVIVMVVGVAERSP